MRRRSMYGTWEVLDRVSHDNELAREYRHERSIEHGPVSSVQEVGRGHSTAEAGEQSAFGCGGVGGGKGLDQEERE